MLQKIRNSKLMKYLGRPLMVAGGISASVACSSSDSNSPIFTQKGEPIQIYDKGMRTYYWDMDNDGNIDLISKPVDPVNFTGRVNSPQYVLAVDTTAIGSDNSKWRSSSFVINDITKYLESGSFTKPTLIANSYRDAVKHHREFLKNIVYSNK